MTFMPREKSARRARRRAPVGPEALEGRALMAANPLSAGDILIQEDYLILLDRQADTASLANARTLLSSPRGDVTLSLLLAQSLEAAAVEAGNAYQSDLGRPASPAEVQAAAGLLQSSGGSPNLLNASLLSSTEFYKAAGNNDVAFVTSLYQHVLGRAPDVAGAGGALSALAQGVNRFVVAYDLLTSPEAAMDAANAAYQAVLGRGADPTGLAAAVQELSSQGGKPPVGSVQAVLVGLINSPENQARIQANVASNAGDIGSAVASASILTDGYYLDPGVALAQFDGLHLGVEEPFAGVKSGPDTLTVRNDDPTQPLVFTPGIVRENESPVQIPASDFTFLDANGAPLTGPITVAPGQTAFFQVAFDLTDIPNAPASVTTYGAAIALINPDGRVLLTTQPFPASSIIQIGVVAQGQTSTAAS